MAGIASFERGEDYCANGHVGSLVEHEGTISAKVRGTQMYRVKLWPKSGRLEYSCTCPVGRDGAFCKHCVAVGLAWLERGKVADTKERKRPKATLTTDDVRAHLEEQSKDALVDILMEHAVDDDRLRQRLLTKAARGAPGRVGLATYRQAIDEAVDVGGFVDYRGASSYASGIEEAIDSIEDLMKDGHEAEAIELIEYALESVEETMGSVDDSDGEMGGILQRLQELHHSACKKAKPNVEELAERLSESYWVRRRAHCLRGWSPWHDRGSIQLRHESGPFGWSARMVKSIRRSGPRSRRSRASSAAPVRRCGIGCARPNAIRASGAA